MAELLDRLVGLWQDWQWERRRRRRRAGARRPCECCGYATLETDPGDWEICPVCFWEDDPVQSRQPDFRGGANQVSLNEARENYRRFGASDQRFLDDVRRPRPEDHPRRETL